jgi:hypothetical protein
MTDDEWEMELWGGRRFALRIFFSARKIPRRKEIISSGLVDLMTKSA